MSIDKEMKEGLILLLPNDLVSLLMCLFVNLFLAVIFLQNEMETIQQYLGNNDDMVDLGIRIAIKLTVIYFLFNILQVELNADCFRTKIPELLTENIQLKKQSSGA